MSEAVPNGASAATPPPEPGGGSRRVRLQTRFFLYFTALIVAIMVPVVLLVEKRTGTLIEDQVRKRGLALARNLAAVCQASLVTYNYVALTQYAERAQRDEEGISDVIILNKEGRVAAYSQHSELQGTELTDAVSLASAATREDLVLPVEIPGDETRGRKLRGLDISVPVRIADSSEKWGTVRIRLITEEMHRQIRETRLLLLALGLAAIGLGALGSLLMARRITGPLSALVSTTIRAAHGDLGARIDVRTDDEIEELARNFNEMIGQIQVNQSAVEELNRGLEGKVKGRTEELSKANRALREALLELRQAEGQLVHSEKMATLGQVVAGVAHEINTPASAINAAVFNVAGYLDTMVHQIPELSRRGLPAALAPRFYDLIGRALAADFSRRPTTADIRERSRALEPRLRAAGFVEPRELALTFARLGLNREIGDLVGASEARPGVPMAFLENVGNLAIAVNDIRVSIEAIAGLVRALKGYSHPDRQELSQVDLHDGLETTLTILRSQLKYGIVVERKYSRLPPVTCNSNELNQVWTNMIHNALQAMNGIGTLSIETCRRDDFAVVRISDTGPGIPSAIRDRIFDPFFTTKDQGEGAGLGLGICQQIVARHKGRILVDSEPGRTTFEILLPLTPQVVESRS